MSVMRVTAYKQLIPLEHAVLTAYNRAGGPECQGLHTALGIISTLRLMKQEGHI